MAFILMIMEYFPPYFDEDDTERCFDTPGIEVHTTLGKLVLTHLNCRMRIFKNTMANHIEYRDDDGELKAFAVSDELMDTLFQEEFPMLSLPYIDQSTGEWLRRQTTKTLEQDLTGE